MSEYILKLRIYKINKKIYDKKSDPRYLINLNEGDTYKIEAKEFEGYDLVVEKLPENAEGTTDTETKAASKEYVGFTANEIKQEYIEGDGKELFYINKTNSILFDLFFLFIVELLNIILVFSIYVWLVPQLNYDYIRIVIICLLYFSVILFVGFLTNSSATTIFFVILYYIVNVFLGRGQNSAFLIYFSSEPLTKKSFLSNYLPLLIISVFLMIFGIVLNRKKIKFK